METSTQAGLEHYRAGFRDWGKRGLLGHAVPAALNGAGDGFAALVPAHEAFGSECRDTGLVLALNAHLWGGLFPMLIHGSEAERARWIPRLVSGAVIAGHAITEPQAGSDLKGLETHAESVADGFRLNGHKRFITNAPIADWLLVYASLDVGLTAFRVHRDDPGVDFGCEANVAACRNATMGDVLLDDCRIPEDRLLGTPGNGLLLVQRSLELERAFVFAGIIGILERQLDNVVRYARTRRIGGHPLAHQQAIAHRIAEMKTRLDGLRLRVRECAELEDTDRRITLASSQTKLVGAEVFLQSSLDAVHIFGAAGLQPEQGLTDLVQDAMASRLFSGSSEVQRNLIAGLLGVGSSR